MERRQLLVLLLLLLVTEITKMLPPELQPRSHRPPHISTSISAPSFPTTTNPHEQNPNYSNGHVTSVSSRSGTRTTKTSSSSRYSPSSFVHSGRIAFALVPCAASLLDLGGTRVVAALILGLLLVHILDSLSFKSGSFFAIWFPLRSPFSYLLLPIYISHLINLYLLLLLLCFYVLILISCLEFGLQFSLSGFRLSTLLLSLLSSVFSLPAFLSYLQLFLLGQLFPLLACPQMLLPHTISCLSLASFIGFSPFPVSRLLSSSRRFYTMAVKFPLIT